MSFRILSKLILLFICCIVLLSSTGLIQEAFAKDRKQEQCVTKQDVLSMLNDCRQAKVTSQDTNDLVNVQLTCEDVCSYYATNQWNTPLTCIGAFYHMATPYGLTEPVDCNVPFIVHSPSDDFFMISCTCCPPD
jgi:hypothetical protein